MNNNLSLNPESSNPKSNPKPNPENLPKRILITGGAGFIGSNLVEYLIEKGYRNITLYDNLSTGNKSYTEQILSKHGKFKIQEQSDDKYVYHLPLNPDHSNPNSDYLPLNPYPLILTLVRGDILDSKKVSEAIQGQDAVVHLAAHTRVLESLENPINNININTKGTFNALEAARKNKVDKFIFASSNAAVGEQIPPINEDMIPQPLSPYGASKLFGEALCSAYYNSYGIKTTALRFANAYGPYSEHKTSVVAKFIKRLKEGKTLEIYGDGNQTRDFIHASDIAQAIHLSLNPYPSNPKRRDKGLSSKGVSGNIYGETFQVATGIETKIINLANMMTDLMKGKRDIEFASERKGEIRKNFSDISKIKGMLGFRPKVKLKEGLENLINQLTN